MSTFKHWIDIRAESETLFNLTQDYDRRLEWDPFLREARLLGGARQAGVGVRAWCVAKSGLGMETEYVSFSPPRVTAVKMTRGPFFLQSFAGAWRFEPIGPEWTRVSFCYHLEARPRWLRPLLNPLLPWVFSRDTVRRLTALKVAAETRDLPAKKNHDQPEHCRPG